LFFCSFPLFSLFFLTSFQFGPIKGQKGQEDHPDGAEPLPSFFLLCLLQGKTQSFSSLSPRGSCLMNYLWRSGKRVGARLPPPPFFFHPSPSRWISLTHMKCVERRPRPSSFTAGPPFSFLLPLLFSFLPKENRARQRCGFSRKIN